MTGVNGVVVGALRRSCGLVLRPNSLAQAARRLPSDMKSAEDRCGTGEAWFAVAF